MRALQSNMTYVSENESAGFRFSTQWLPGPAGRDDGLAMVAVASPRLAPLASLGVRVTTIRTRLPTRFLQASLAPEATPDRREGTPSS